MFWAFIAIIAATLLAITLSNRGVVRVIGAVLLVAVLLSGVVIRLMSDASDLEGQRGDPSSPAAAVNAIELDPIQVDNLQLTGGGAPFELRGRISNASTDTHVRSITLRIARRDCHQDSQDPSGCTLIWQDQQWIPVNVPADSERTFTTSFYARTPVSRLRGTLKDEFSLVAATGESLDR